MDKTPTIALQNVLLIGITIPLIKIQTKDVENIKQMLWQASTFHKLPKHALIINFGKVKLLKLFEFQFVT